MALICVFSLKCRMRKESQRKQIHYAHSKVAVILVISVFEQFGVDGENATETLMWTRSVQWSLNCN